MQRKSTIHMLAVIREADCIGCTKCIQACPVDAILGANKQMHTVIADECIGCKLCVEPCPVDCIDMIAIAEKNSRPEHFKNRYQIRKKRLQQKELSQTTAITDKKSYIQEALLRAKHKKTKI